MEAKFIEKYSLLKEMQPGDIAVSKDRKKFFVCGQYYDKEKKENIKNILNLNDLRDQYSDSWNMNTDIRLLKIGDKIVIER